MYIYNNSDKLVSQDDVRRIGDIYLQRLLSPGVLSIKIANVTAAKATLANFD